jgi:hypothetical protein
VKTTIVSVIIIEQACEFLAFLTFGYRTHTYFGVYIDLIWIISALVLAPWKKRTTSS